MSISRRTFLEATALSGLAVGSGSGHARADAHASSGKNRCPGIHPRHGRRYLSEQRVGKAIKGRREGIFLATKISSRDPDQAPRVVEESLKALQVDQVDLIHIHELTTAEDLAGIEVKGGALDLVRPAVFKTALERHDFDCAPMTLNAGMVGMASGPRKGGLV